jgi:hypothetical protein
MGRIDVSPDPAHEGQPVTITVTGPGPWLISRNPDGEIREYQANASGQIELTAPPGAGGESFTILNSEDPPAQARIDIVSQNNFGG